VGGVCARQFCSAPSIARVDFDGEARVVWIDELGDHKPAAACCLCRRHADTLTPPRNWELRDLRPQTPLPLDDRPMVVTIPNEAPPVPSPVAAEAAPAWSPSLFASVDTGAVLEATSPLLSRAFHGVR
jgi:hypothetical protein